MRKEFDQPSSLEAEKAVLGGLLLKPDLWDTVSVTVDEKDFILSKLSTPTPERILYIGQALRDGISIKDIYVIFYYYSTKCLKSQEFI